MKRTLLMSGATVKRTSLMVIASLMTAAGFAQEITEPYVLEEFVAMEISPDGNYVVCQDMFGNTYLFNNEKEQLEGYEGNYPGNGNCVSNTGVMVGQAMDEFAVIMKDEKVVAPASLASTTLSTLNGITSDGQRVCGWMANSTGETIVVPFYADFGANGELGEPVKLPYPEKDFLGSKPQYITTSWISEDGNTILGQVTDGTGFYSYPIVFKQGADSEWDYYTPSEVLFNPDNLEIPKFPGSNDNLDQYYQSIDDYWKQMAQIVKGSNFVFGVSAMNPQGTIIASCIGITNDDEGLSDDYKGYQLCVFDLTDESYKKIELEYPNLVPTKILSDGTIICVNLDTNTSYLVDYETEEVTPFENYVEKTNPSLIPWLEENMGRVWVDKTDGEEVEMLATGYLWMSDNKACTAGGYIGNGVFTYIYSNEESQSVEFPTPIVAAPPTGVSSFSTLSIVWDYKVIELGETENRMVTITTPSGEQYTARGYGEYILEDDKGGTGGGSGVDDNALTVSYYNQLVQAGSDTYAFMEEGVYTISVKAGAVYIDGVPNPAAELTYVIGDGAGVESLGSEVPGEETIYDLMGVKVNKDNLKKGIYIINGKKVMVK